MPKGLKPLNQGVILWGSAMKSQARSLAALISPIPGWLDLGSSMR